MRRAITFPVTALALAAGFVTPAAASASQPVRGPEHVTVEIASVNGSGCPAGTVTAAVSEDNKTMTVSYSDYTAWVGGSAKPTDMRKNCQVALKVNNIPPNTTFRVQKEVYRGHASLQADSKATVKSSHYWQGQSNSRNPDFDVNGPHSDAFQAVYNYPVGQPWIPPCPKKSEFNLNTELRANKGTSDPSAVNSISFDSGVDGSTTYHLEWLSCTP